MTAPYTRVKHVIDAVYAESGFRPASKESNDPESKYVLEQEARKRALAHLDPQDRNRINSCTKCLKDRARGTYLGDSAALQVLMHLGIFLSRAGKNQE